MGDAQDRYWKAVKSSRDDVRKRASGAALQWSDRFELMGREVETEASLLRLCQDAHDEALKDLFDSPRQGFAKRSHEFQELWPKQVLAHEELLQYSIRNMEQMQIWRPRFKEENSDIHSDD